MFIEFVIQNQFFSNSLKEFAKILDIPYEGACVFTDKWLLDELAYGVPTDGPYQTNPPSPDDIISFIRIDREGQVCRTRLEKEIDVLKYQVLTHEIKPTLKPLEEIIRESIFCLGGNRDRVPVCLCYMLYCVVHSKKFNLAYYMAKRMEWVTRQKRLILPYDMLLTRLFKVIMNEIHEFYNESYVLYDRVMNPLAAQQERKLTSSSPAFDQPSFSHLNDDDDDGNSERTSCASIPSPIPLEAQAANMATDNTNRNPEQAPVARKYSYKEFMSCQPFNFKGLEGAAGLTRWFERMKLVFSRSNYIEDCKVKFATSTLTEEALSWWNSFAQPIRIEEAYKITWVEFKKLLIKKFQELALLCPNMVPNSEKLIEVFIEGLPRSIKGNVNASKPQTLEEDITITQRLMEQVIKHNSAQETNDHKRKFKDGRNTTNNNNYPIDHNNNNHSNNRNNNYQKTITTTIIMITTSSRMERKPSGIMEIAIRPETVEAKNFCFQISLYHSTKSQEEISHDVIGVVETGSGKAVAFISRKPKMRVMIPSEKFCFLFDWDSLIGRILTPSKSRSNPTPREQRHDKRDIVHEEHNKVSEKDLIINQKQSKKQEREEEVDSIKGQTFRIMRSGVKSKADAFISRKLKIRVMIPSEKKIHSGKSTHDISKPAITITKLFFFHFT
uniref:Reverse transcriptase domain-containing protein n=1 Tax=Tanacetum cinerariifolium TaxID=118510 RepID=A0A6L2N3S4_TANCI|nr:reverse transcriptase domain-containing protein [Tanacetum cinerariifolium]